MQKLLRPLILDTLEIRQVYSNYDPSNLIYSFPNSVRPVDTWSSFPAYVYVSSSHNSWLLRNTGSSTGTYEIQWVYILRR